MRRTRILLIVLTTFLCLVFFAGVGQAATPPVILNEILVGNAGTNLDPDLVNYSSWIELRNTSGSGVNLNNYLIESWPDGATTPDSFVLTNLSIPGNGYLLLWADETSKPRHLPFELDMDGGIVRLTAPNGDFSEVIFDFDQSMDVSYGRNGSGDWAFFDQPTPGAANSTPDYPDNQDDNFAPVPDFSVAGGLYDAQFGLELTIPASHPAHPDARIRYTTDGSRPTASSPLYTGPIPISATTLVRARLWYPGLMVSPTATESYFFGINTNLPVISLVTDNANLFDPRIGIYVVGSYSKAAGPNWKRPWTRPANIEFYELAGPGVLDQVINQEIGLEISGNRTRKFAQKSLEIKARKHYGDNDMDYPFFAGEKPMTSYKRLILRNAGNDNHHAYLRDVIGHSIARDRMDIDRPAYRPVVAYLNGQYWGIYNLVEKTDEDFVENNYDLDADEFDMLDTSGVLMNGSKDIWLAFIKYLRYNSAASPAVYATIAEQVDIPSFIDYIILETFVGNADWPMNNSRWWNDYDANYRWRWVLRDLDKTFFPPNLRRDMISFTLNANGPTALLFKNLWNNQGFRQEFAQRYATHLNTTFQPARVVGLIDGLAAGIRDEMPAHIARWRRPQTLVKWEGEIDILRFQANNRPFYARETLRKRIGNPGDATLSVTFEGDGNGQVFVAGATVPDGYSGPHFKNIPIQMTAKPDSGNVFSHWVVNGSQTITDNPTTLPFNGNTTVEAHFEPIPLPLIVINELHHTSPSDDDIYEFLELYNADVVPVDLSGYTFIGVNPPTSLTSSFPAGTFIAPGEYIVVADTPATYTSQGYQVFDFNGGLSANGEEITLKDTDGNIIDTVTYTSTDPWPTTPNAGGPSLSLLDPALDNSLPGSWAPSNEPGGTPGAVNFGP